MNQRDKSASGEFPDEETLINSCRSGNAKAQKQLYDKYAPKLFGVCLRYAIDHNMAEDFLQEGFIRIFLKIDSFEAKGSLEGWMRRIVVNTALEKLRKRDILKNSIDIDAVEQQSLMSNGSAKDYLVAESDDYSEIDEQFPADAIFKIMKDMPIGFRTVFNLFAIEEYSHKEISAMLGITEGTSKSQYARARVWLQKRLTERKRSSNA
jgi:RNA polymerase sigma-70 factor (ECF subfamily)